MTQGPGIVTENSKLSRPVRGVQRNYQCSLIRKWIQV